MSQNSFGAQNTLAVGGREYEIFRLDALQARFDVARLPFSLKVLLENLLRNEDGEGIRAQDVQALASWDAGAQPSQEIAFTPARVVMQDFTGVPAIVDLAAMRDAMAAMGGDPAKINPLVPAELVIDHSVQVDEFGTRYAFDTNARLEFERNRERYAFLRWGQQGFDNFKVVPPDTGIVHQVNLEYLARVVFVQDSGGAGVSAAAGAGDGGAAATGAGTGLPRAYPDTLVGTDSHTTMVNGLGVLGWGVGGIEAEAAMLGQPMSMLIPQVLGFELVGELREGATATDLVLTVTERLREHGVVGKFVEFYGAGIAKLPLADRATIGNMSPEFGSTCAIFPIDAETLRYLEFTGRPAEQIELVEVYAKAQGLWHDEHSEQPSFSETLTLDLGEVVPSIAGPKRPQDRISLSDSQHSFRRTLGDYVQSNGADSYPASDPPANGAPGHSGPVATAVPLTLADGTQNVARSWSRGDRGHYQLHQHLQSLRDAGRRSAGAQCCREGPAEQAVGEDLAGAWLQGRDRVLRTRQPHRAAGGAGVQPRRLWLHHLHRQLRAAAGGGLQGGQRRRSGGLLGALGQSQLRGAHQPRCEDELPRLAAARGRLCLGGDHGYRPARRSARRGR